MSEQLINDVLLVFVLFCLAGCFVKLSRWSKRLEAWQRSIADVQSLQNQNSVRLAIRESQLEQKEQAIGLSVAVMANEINPVCMGIDMVTIETANMRLAEVIGRN